MSATWHYGRLKETTLSLRNLSHMDYHAPYMTWYRRITRRFITPMSDFGPMRYQATALFAHLLVRITYVHILYNIYSNK